MKKLLVTGATGQISSELTLALRDRYNNDNVIAAGHLREPDEALLESGPCCFVDCKEAKTVSEMLENYKLDTIYHLAAILSATAEKTPQLAWHVNMMGLYNVLEVAREYGCAVFISSPIGAFGPTAPRDNTPQDTIQRPTTMYGVTKAAGELVCDYYHHRFSLDVRGFRYPGLISYKTPPGGGTTDYAVEVYYEAIQNKRYRCYLKEGTYLDMIYIPDAIKAVIELMEAHPGRLRHRNAFNVSAMSFAPEHVAAEIQKSIPESVIEFDVGPVRQGIADSLPNIMDDSAAREEWGWQPHYDLDSTTKDMLQQISRKLGQKRMMIGGSLP